MGGGGRGLREGEGRGQAFINNVRYIIDSRFPCVDINHTKQEKMLPSQYMFNSRNYVCICTKICAVNRDKEI